MYTSAQQISDELFLAAIAEAEQRTGSSIGVSAWDLALVLDGRADEIAPLEERAFGWTLVEPDTAVTIVRKKARRTYRRGLTLGCICGCRGDFELTAEGRARLAEAGTFA